MVVVALAVLIVLAVTVSITVTVILAFFALFCCFYRCIIILITGSIAIVYLLKYNYAI